MKLNNIYTLTVDKLIKLIIDEIKTNSEFKNINAKYQQLIKNIDFLSKENVLLRNLDNSSRNVGNEILKCFPRDDFNKLDGSEEVYGDILVYHRSSLHNIHDRILNVKNIEEAKDIIKSNSGILHSQTEAIVIIYNGKVVRFKVKCVDEYGKVITLNKKENLDAFKTSDKIWVELKE